MTPGVLRCSIGARVYFPLPLRAETLLAVIALGGFIIF